MKAEMNNPDDQNINIGLNNFDRDTPRKWYAPLS